MTIYKYKIIAVYPFQYTLLLPVDSANWHGLNNWTKLSNNLCTLYIYALIVSVVISHWDNISRDHVQLIVPSFLNTIVASLMRFPPSSSTVPLALSNLALLLFQIYRLVLWETSVRPSELSLRPETSSVYTTRRIQWSISRYHFSV